MKKKKSLPTYPTFLDRVGRGQTEVILNVASRADNSAVKGRIWPKFEIIRDVMAILVTSKYEEDPIKIEGA